MQQSRLGPRSFAGLIILLWMAPPLATDIYLSALPRMIEDFSTGPEILNMTMYGFMMVMAVFTFLMGPISDKYGRVPVLRICLAEFIATAALSAVMTDIWLFIIFRILQAVGAGGAVTIGVALIKDSYEGKARADILKATSVLGVLAPILAPIIGMAIMSVTSWRATLAVPVALGFLCLFMSAMLDETLPPEQRVRGGLSKTLHIMRGIARSRSFTAFLVMSSLPYLPFMAHISVSSYIYQDYFGMSAPVYTVILAATLAAGTVSMLAITRAAAKTVARRLVPLFPVLLSVSAVLMFLFGHRAWYLFFVSFLFTIATSMTLRPFSMNVLMASHRGDSGVVSSMINFVFFTAGCIGMVVSTMTFWSDYITAMTVIIAVAAVLFVLLWAAGRGGEPLKGLDDLVSGEER